MKLIHFSGYKTLGPLHTYKQSNDRDALPRTGIGKPRGFWVSDESKGAHGWKSWCEAEDFRLWSLRYEHEVILHPQAKILYLRSAAAIDRFTKKYRDETSLSNRAIAHIGDEPDTMEINWPAVAEKYQGIIITPYIWERRLGMSCTWYYGWDCASGCIWDGDAIQEIMPARENKKYAKLKEPTPGEEKAAREKWLNDIRKLNKDLAARIPKEAFQNAKAD